jgi:hypothetical protein
MILVQYKNSENKKHLTYLNICGIAVQSTDAARGWNDRPDEWALTGVLAPDVRRCGEDWPTKEDTVGGMGRPGKQKHGVVSMNNLLWAYNIRKKFKRKIN